GASRARLPRDRRVAEVVDELAVREPAALGEALRRLIAPVALGVVVPRLDVLLPRDRARGVARVVDRVLLAATREVPARLPLDGCALGMAHGDAGSEKASRRTAGQAPVSRAESCSPSSSAARSTLQSSGSSPEGVGGGVCRSAFIGGLLRGLRRLAGDDLLDGAAQRLRRASLDLAVDLVVAGLVVGREAGLERGDACENAGLPGGDGGAALAGRGVVCGLAADGGERGEERRQGGAEDGADRGAELSHRAPPHRSLAPRSRPPLASSSTASATSSRRCGQGSRSVASGPRARFVYRRSPVYVLRSALFVEPNVADPPEIGVAWKGAPTVPLAAAFVQVHPALPPGLAMLLTVTALPVAVHVIQFVSVPAASEKAFVASERSV